MNQSQDPIKLTTEGFDFEINYWFNLHHFLWMESFMNTQKDSTIIHQKIPKEAERTMDSNLGNSDEEIKTLSVIHNNKTSTMTILNPNNLDIEGIDILDVAGKLIRHQTIRIHELDRISVSTRELSSAVYVIKIILKDRNIMSNKIIVSH